MRRGVSTPHTNRLIHLLPPSDNVAIQREFLNSLPSLSPDAMSLDELVETCTKLDDVLHRGSVPLDKSIIETGFDFYLSIFNSEEAIKRSIITSRWAAEFFGLCKEFDTSDFRSKPRVPGTSFWSELFERAYEYREAVPKTKHITSLVREFSHYFDEQEAEAVFDSYRALLNPESLRFSYHFSRMCALLPKVYTHTKPVFLEELFQLWKLYSLNIEQSSAILRLFATISENNLLYRKLSDSSVTEYLRELWRSNFKMVLSKIRNQSDKCIKLLAQITVIHSDVSFATVTLYMFKHMKSPFNFFDHVNHYIKICLYLEEHSEFPMDPSHGFLNRTSGYEDYKELLSREFGKMLLPARTIELGPVTIWNAIAVHPELLSSISPTRIMSILSSTRGTGRLESAFSLLTAVVREIFLDDRARVKVGYQLLDEGVFGKVAELASSGSALSFASLLVLLEFLIAFPIVKVRDKELVSDPEVRKRLPIIEGIARSSLDIVLDRTSIQVLKNIGERVPSYRGINKTPGIQEYLVWTFLSQIDPAYFGDFFPKVRDALFRFDFSGCPRPFEHLMSSLTLASPDETLDYFFDIFYDKIFSDDSTESEKLFFLRMLNAMVHRSHSSILRYRERLGTLLDQTIRSPREPVFELGLRLLGALLFTLTTINIFDQRSFPCVSSASDEEKVLAFERSPRKPIEEYRDIWWIPGKEEAEYTESLLEKYLLGTLDTIKTQGYTSTSIRVLNSVLGGATSIYQYHDPDSFYAGFLTESHLIKFFKNPKLGKEAVLEQVLDVFLDVDKHISGRMGKEEVDIVKYSIDSIDNLYFKGAFRLNLNITAKSVKIAVQDVMLSGEAIRPHVVLVLLKKYTQSRNFSYLRALPLTETTMRIFYKLLDLSQFSFQDVRRRASELVYRYVSSLSRRDRKRVFPIIIDRITPRKESLELAEGALSGRNVSFYHTHLSIALQYHEKFSGISLETDEYLMTDLLDRRYFSAIGVSFGAIYKRPTPRLSESYMRLFSFIEANITGHWKVAMVSLRLLSTLLEWRRFVDMLPVDNVFSVLHQGIKYRNPKIRMYSLELLIRYTKLYRPIQPLLKDATVEITAPESFDEFPANADEYSRTTFIDTYLASGVRTSNQRFRVYDYGKPLTPSEKLPPELFRELCAKYGVDTNVLEIIPSVVDSPRYVVQNAMLVKRAMQFLGDVDEVLKYFPLKDGMDSEMASRHNMEILSGIIRGSKHHGFECMSKGVRLFREVVLSDLENVAAPKNIISGISFICKGLDPRRFSMLFPLIFDSKVLRAAGNSRVESVHVSIINALYSAFQTRIPSRDLFGICRKALESWEYLGEGLKPKYLTLLNNFFDYSVGMTIRGGKIAYLPDGSERANEYASFLLKVLSLSMKNHSLTKDKVRQKMLSGLAARIMNVFVRALKELKKFPMVFSAECIGRIISDAVFKVPRKAFPELEDSSQYLAVSIPIRVECISRVPDLLSRVVLPFSERSDLVLSQKKVFIQFVATLFVQRHHQLPSDAQDILVGVVYRFLYDESADARKRAQCALTAVANHFTPGEISARFQRFREEIDEAIFKVGRGSLPRSEGFLLIDGSVRGICALLKSQIKFGIDDFVVSAVFYIGSELRVKSKMIDETISEALATLFKKYQPDHMAEYLDKETLDKMLEIREEREEFRYFC